MNILKAEWTKLRTTRSFWWTTAIFFVFVWGWAVLQGTLTSSQEGLLFSDAVLAILFLLGIPVLMIQAIMVVTTEYRYGLQTTMYMASPKRFQVVLTKLLMYAAIAALLVFIGVVGALLISSWTASGTTAEMYKPFEEEAAKRSMWAYPLIMALIVLFVQGVGLLLRQTAGTVAVSLILYLGLDQLIGLVPKVGEKIVPFLPFAASNNWLNRVVPEPAPWDADVVNLIVFIVWGVVLWGLGVLLLQKRDV